MKTRIFNHALIAFVAIILTGTGLFAQGTPPPVPAMPPTPPESYTLDKDFDSAKFDKAMGELNVKMKELGKKMAKLSAEQTKLMAVKMKGLNKDLNKNLNANFNMAFKDLGKDFGKNFSGSFNGLAPKGDYNLNYNYSYNGSKLSQKEYAQKVASGEFIEKVKNYSKSYSVDANDVLQISNSFGRVTVNTWNKNEFKVDVQMKFSAPSEQRVNEMINGSSISDTKTGSVVSFKTNIYKNNGRNEDNNMEINYTVYMPAGNALDLSNKFGNVILPSLSGKVTLRLQFGVLTAQQLTNSQNDITIKFSQDATSNIAVCNAAALKVEFSGFKAGVIDNGTASFSFSDVVIDRLKSSSDISIKFGDGLRIGAIDKAAKNVKINASNTKLDLDINESFNFDITTRMGNFKYDDDKVKVVSKTPSDEERGWSSTKNYKGYVGRNNGSNNIIVTARFAEVNIK